MKRLTVLSLCVVMIGLQGCLKPRVDLVRQGQVSLDIQSSPHIKVTWVHVYHEPDGVTVTGLMTHQDDDCAVIKVHVDVAVLNQAQQVLTETESLPVYVQTERTAHASQGKAFSVTLPVDLPTPATVRVKVHYDEQDE